MKKLMILLLCATMTAGTIMMSACSSDNADKFYGNTLSESSPESSKTPSESSQSGSDQSSTTESSTSSVENKLLKDYSLDFPDYSEYYELGEHKGITYYIDDDYYKITDDMVTNRVAENLGLTANDVKDRGAKYGDTIIVSFKGTVNGKDFDGNEMTDYSTVLGAGKLSMDFEDQIVGMKAGEKKKIEYTFPKTYSDSTIAGKKAVFDLTLSKLKAYSLKDVKDEDVEEKTSVKTLNEYKEQIKKELEKESDTQKTTDITSIVLAKITENSKVVKYDEDQLTKYIDSAKNSIESSAKQKNMSVDDFVKNTYGYKTYDDYVETLRPSAEAYFQSIMLISSLAKAENIKVTDDEYKNQINSYINDYNISVEELNTYYKSEDIVFSILVKKVQNWVIENSVKLDKPETES